jgi:hypothetical protein
MVNNMKTQDLLGEPSVTALGQIYNSPLASTIAREDLLEDARVSLMKYDLGEDELEIAADSLARSMHMLLEQRGLEKLEPEQIVKLECEVLDFCGIGQHQDPAKLGNRK